MQKDFLFLGRNVAVWCDAKCIFEGLESKEIFNHCASYIESQNDCVTEFFPKKEKRRIKEFTVKKNGNISITFILLMLDCAYACCWI